MKVAGPEFRSYRFTAAAACSLFAHSSGTIAPLLIELFSASVFFLSRRFADQIEEPVVGSLGSIEKGTGRLAINK